MYRILKYILGHPLNRGRRMAALLRFARWQIGSRLLPGPVAVPFVGETRLLVRRGMTGATGNIYGGLAEFEEMAFVLHGLRAGDLFADVGANVGAYTVLASGVCGAHTVAMEPVPATFRCLEDNVRINRLEPRVTLKNIAVGARHGELRFTTELDTVNHVWSDRDAADTPSMAVPVLPLDEVLAGLAPVMLKVDVEGYEAEVARGAEQVLREPSLRAVLMELNGSGARYGFDEGPIRARMKELGFTACRYDPFARRLANAETGEHGPETALFVRDPEAFTRRLQDAPARVVLGRKL